MHSLTPNFKALGSDRRLAILAFLKNNIQNVTSIAQHLRVSGPTASYHLRKLLREKYIQEIRKGKHSFYQCSPKLEKSRLYQQILRK